MFARFTPKILALALCGTAVLCNGRNQNTAGRLAKQSAAAAAANALLKPTGFSPKNFSFTANYA